MKKFIYILLLVVGFTSCKKEDKTSSVSYKVVTDGNTAGYTVWYSLPDGSTKSEGISSNAVWTSETIKEYKKGTAISFSLESNGGSYHMYIYVNGAFNKHRDAGGGGVQSLETTIPNY